MSTKVKVEEVVIDGTTYVPKESLIKSPNYEGDVCIVVLQRGWVYVGRLREEKNMCILTNAYNIRLWGTTKGLAELCDGPTSNTKLDKVNGIVKFRPGSEIHLITVNKEKWPLI